MRGKTKVGRYDTWQIAREGALPVARYAVTLTVRTRAAGETGVGGVFDQWLSHDGAELRKWLASYLPDPLRWLADAPPLWLIEVIAAVVIIVLVLGALYAAVVAAGIAWQMVRRPFSTLTVAIKPGEPAKGKDVKDLKDAFAAQSSLLMQMKAQLDRLAAAANPNAAPDPAERERRDAAVAGIVADRAPAAKSAVSAIIAGDLSSAVATLERDARAATDAVVGQAVDAAEKWRRLGALVREIDTAKALAAYEAAFALQPAEFWTCIELSRLRGTAGGTSGARAAAEAAGRAAGTDRERSVALNDLGDVLVAQGDEAGALASYRDSLAIFDRLAKSDPGNAGWQRDLIVSYTRSAGALPGQGWWRKAHEVASRLVSEGRLAPVDAWMVGDTAEKAKADGG